MDRKQRKMWKGLWRVLGILGTGIPHSTAWLPCDEVLKELFGTSKAENRDEVFLLRAKAREGKGITTEEERVLCIKDFLTAYHMVSFYKGEAEAEALKQYIGGKYGWQYID